MVLDGKLLILLHNPFFDEWPELPAECSVPCAFTTDRSAAEVADAVVVHVPSLRSMAGLMARRPDQLLVAWSMESRVMCPPLAIPAFMDHFDLTMTYERSSDVWDPYFEPSIVPYLHQPAGRHIAPSPVVSLQRNPDDACGRAEYVADLMKVVRVDSFGDLHRNQMRSIPAGWLPRHQLYGEYKMTLAFENSVAPDYVTEKFFEPLAAGSVPVYRGTSEVRELAPAQDCYINADDFDSAQELGEYLDHLDHSEDDYMRYHEWRARGPSQSFLDLVAQVTASKFCRLADAVAARLGHGTPHGRTGTHAYRE